MLARNTCSDYLSLHVKLINVHNIYSQARLQARGCFEGARSAGPGGPPVRSVRPALVYRIPRIHEGDVLLVDGAGAIEVVLVEEGHDLVQIALVQLPRGY